MLADKKGQNEKKRQHIEFEFPIVLVRIHSFMSVYDRLGASKVSSIISWGALFCMPIVACFGLYFIFNTIHILLTIPEAREIGRELGLQAYISLPGINPLLPIFYSWIGIIVGIIVHEGAHGVIARNVGIKIKSSVLLFLLALPIGAGVDLDEEQMKKADAKDSTRVLAAGTGANIIIAFVCIFSVIMISNGLTPVVDGLYIIEVMEGMPAEEAGLLPEDVIVMVDNKSITTFEEFTTVLTNKSVNDIVQVTVARGEKWRDRLIIPVTLTEHEGVPYMGVNISEMLIEQRLRIYQKLATEIYPVHFQPPTLGSSRNVIPFSDVLHTYYTHNLGEQWYILANIFFWVWYININLAIFNALPIYPLDGGRAFKNLLSSVLGNRASEALVSRFTYAVTIGMIFAMAMMIALPFIL